MSLPWKITLVLLLLLAVWLLYRDVSRPVDSSVTVVTNTVVKVSESVSTLSNLSQNASFGVPCQGEKRERLNMPSNNLSVAVSPPSPRFFRGEFSFGCAGSDSWVYFDGDLFRVGCPSEFGRVVVIDRYFLVCIDENGCITYLLPRKNINNNNNAPRVPSPRFTSSGDGTRGASIRSW